MENVIHRHGLREVGVVSSDGIKVFVSGKDLS